MRTIPYLLFLDKQAQQELGLVPDKQAQQELGIPMAHSTESLVSVNCMVPFEGKQRKDPDQMHDPTRVSIWILERPPLYRITGICKLYCFTGHKRTYPDQLHGQAILRARHLTTY